MTRQGNIALWHHPLIVRGHRKDKHKPPLSPGGTLTHQSRRTHPGIKPGSAPEPRTNSVISQDGLPQTPLSPWGSPTHPLMRQIHRYNTQYCPDPLLIVPYLNLGYHNPSLGPWRVPTHPLSLWRVPTNKPHPYPTRYKSRCRSGPLNNYPGLSQLPSQSKGTPTNTPEPHPNPV